MAEGEGFEPPLPFRVKRFSRPPVSTAHTFLRVSVINSLPAPTASPNRRSCCSPASCGFPYEESTVYRHFAITTLRIRRGSFFFRQLLSSFMRALSQTLGE